MVKCIGFYIWFSLKRQEDTLLCSTVSSDSITRGNSFFTQFVLKTSYLVPSRLLPFYFFFSFTASFCSTNSFTPLTLLPLLSSSLFLYLLLHYSTSRGRVSPCGCVFLCHADKVILVIGFPASTTRIITGTKL